MEFSGGEFTLKLLASIEATMRVAALKVFKRLSTLKLSTKFMAELFVRITVLLEEGLQLYTINQNLDKVENLQAEQVIRD